ncbi:rRNA pseudouridine synthase [Dyella subtropica]|uniref:rRNA pseudouridine synthase n=1 Tax=Dyella subtropica TaxID=2992127 RepID=UPI00225584EA|nr:rRNA pseudouridine synthase [Dyella subtropica]
MTDPVRLAKRVIEQMHCSRREAELYIEGGWVRVDGEVVDLPQFMVSDQIVTIDPDADLQPIEPATILLHKPVIAQVGPWPVTATSLVTPDTRWAEDDSGIRTLKRHFAALTSPLPLDQDASGLLVLTQDGRVASRLSEDADRIEQEYIVEVSGTIAPDGLQRLSHGLSYQGRALPSCKVSWQNETHLRFAIKFVRSGQIRYMCAQVGLTVVSAKRIRIGRIPLRKMAPGEWRYLPASERF